MARSWRDLHTRGTYPSQWFIFQKRILHVHFVCACRKPEASFCCLCLNYPRTHPYPIEMPHLVIFYICVRRALRQEYAPLCCNRMFKWPAVASFCFSFFSCVPIEENEMCYIVRWGTHPLVGGSCVATWLKNSLCAVPRYMRNLFSSHRMSGTNPGPVGQERNMSIFGCTLYQQID